MVLSAQIAAVYAAILIPFKVGIPLIPGFAELRPANAIPIVASLLFGPAAAWGAGIGNVIGDCFGTLGPASVFGCLGNFLFGYVPYKLWGHLGPLSSGREPRVQSWRQGLEYVLICVVASWICAASIAWGVQLLGLLPFSILAPAIFINNMVMGILLGPPLLQFLYPRVQRWGLLYGDLHAHILAQKSVPGATQPLDSDPSRVTNSPEPEVVVDVCRVSFRYRDASEPALDNLSFRVKRGELVFVMGRSGSGKSTLCYALNGMIPQFLGGEFSGQIAVLGCRTPDRPVWQQASAVGLVFQDFDTQLVSTNVEMELAHPLEHLRPPLSQDEMRRRLSEALDRVGLRGLERRDPLSLSGGQRQRLVIASALVRRPSLLVFDQPMTDLDPLARREFTSLLQSLQSQGFTMIVTEHDPEETLQADRLVVLESGAVIWEGHPHDFWSQPGLPERHGLRPLPISQSFVRMNLPRLPVTVEEAWMVMEQHGLAFVPTSQESRTAAPAAVEQPLTEDEVPAIQLERVSFSYDGSHPVVHDVSLTIASGECVAILGRNGSGKSTLAKLLNGLLRPTAGCVLVAGVNTRDVPMGQLAQRVGYVFQNPDHQIFAETVWDEVSFGAKNVGCSEEECAQRVKESLLAVGFSTDASRDTDPFSLTKGERQRVAVASVLASRPHILIFDEPTTGLDAVESHRMMRMIKNLNQEGHTILMITHAMWLVAEYAERCVLMKDGTILADGSTRAVFTQSDLVEAASLDVPPVTRFSRRWGATCLTADEVRSLLRQP